MNLFLFVTVLLYENPNRFFIFCHVTENEAKEHARVPRRFALPCASRLRSDAPKLTPLSAGFKQVAASFSTADGMLGAGQRGLQNRNPNTLFKPISRALPGIYCYTDAPQYNLKPSRGRGKMDAFRGRRHLIRVTA